MTRYKRFVKLQIHYFSGTGYSRNVAIVLQQEALAVGMEVELIDLSRTDRLHIQSPANDAFIVFVSPVHGFNYPPVMLHYLFRFPKGRNNVMLMNTRAGMLIGKWVTPGISGVSLYLSALILRFKGYSIQALYPVDLPSNWISIHPALNKRTVDFIYTKTLPKVRILAESVFAGKKNFWSVRECLIDVLVAPIAVLYYLVGRFVIAKTFYASKDCTKCGLCEQTCPIHAIKTVDARPFWTFKCESCMMCMNNCPKRAIETAHGFVVAVAAGFSFLLSAVLYRYFDFSFIIQNKVLDFIFENIFFVALLAVFYRLFHYLLRFCWFERVAAFTSLTKFKFWGRYKAWKLRL